MRVLLIIPAYNEEANIVKTIASITAFAAFSHPYELDYIVINDGSSDNTQKICEQNKIKVINLLKNLGIGGAVQTGYIYAKTKDYDIAVQFDGDGQHDINSLDNVILPIISGEADFVVGSRFVEKNNGFKSTLARRMGIRFLSVIIRIFSGCKISDPTSGYRAVRKEIIAVFAKNYPVDYAEPESIVELSKYRFKMKEVSVNMFEREGGQSSIRAWKTIYFMFKVSIAIICTSFQKKVK